MKRIVSTEFENEKTLKNFYEESDTFLILDDDSAGLFEAQIRPILIQANSPYQNVTLAT